jgi:hypothetical protein
VLDFVFDELRENGTLVLKCVGVGTYMKLFYFILIIAFGWLKYGM